MFNLLSSEHKLALRKIYRLRFIFMALLFSVLVLLLVVLALVPALFLSNIKKEIVQQSLTTASNEGDTSIGEIQKRIEHAKAVLNSFGTATSSTLIAAHLNDLIIAKPADVKIRTVSVVGSRSTPEAPATEKFTVRLGGVATTREGLRAYEAALKDLPQTGIVLIPVSVFAKSRDLPFTIEITIL